MPKPHLGPRYGMPCECIRPSVHILSGPAATCFMAVQPREEQAHIAPSFIWGLTGEPFKACRATGDDSARKTHEAPSHAQGHEQLQDTSSDMCTAAALQQARTWPARFLVKAIANMRRR